MSMNNELGNFLNKMPQLTRYWFILTVGCSLLSRFGIVPIYYVYLDYDLVIYKCQLWRLITSIFFYPITQQTGFHFLVNLYFLYQYSTRLENDMFPGKTADYFFLLLINWTSTLVVSFFLGIYFLMDPLVIAVMYIWCQSNKDVLVQFWFGTNVKAMYLPWVLAGFNFIIRGSATYEIAGILAGHFYHFFMFQYPLEFGGSQILNTPNFIKDLFPQNGPRMATFAGPEQFGRRPPQTAPSTGSYFSNTFPGRGQRLGG